MQVEDIHINLNCATAPQLQEQLLHVQSVHYSSASGVYDASLSLTAWGRRDAGNDVIIPALRTRYS